jgi:hypothetical protein
VVGITRCAKWPPGADTMGSKFAALSGKSEKEWYCFGQTLLRMECEDRAFSRRFKDIFGECAVAATEDVTAPHVDFRVAVLPSDPSVLAVSVIPSQPDGADFMRRLVPERRYVECPEITPGWQMLALPDAPEEPVLAFGPSGILVSRSHPWQQAIALYAISSTFRLQPDVYVLHAASVGISGRGVLLSGAKGAGKTTLSLCFASRGHAFLGDEWAAVSSLTGELLPLRRAASIRPGPQAAGVDEYLQSRSCDTEILPDGTKRVRTKVGMVFPRALPQVVPLTDIFFLGRFAPRPVVERFTPSRGELPPISPMLASVWGYPPAERALQLFRTLGKARWWHLDAGGSPEETADLIEETLKEGLWD